MCSLHSVFFLFVVCALFCIACRSPALSLSFIGRRRVDPRKVCHLGEISRKKQSWMLGPKFFTFQAVDTLPEWSKGWTQVPLVQTVGSNPTGVIWPHSSSPTPTTKQSVAAAGMLSPTEALSPGRAVRGLSLTVQAD